MNKHPLGTWRRSFAWLAGLSLLGLTACQQPEPEVALFNGKDLAGWREPRGKWQVVKEVKLDGADAKKFAFVEGEGVMVNGRNERTSDIISVQEFGDVEAQIEFCVPKNSNSGIYFMGRYEVQVFDSWGVEKPKHSDCGGIYERWKDNKGYEGHAPRVNASKPPGEWQTFQVIFRAPRFDAAGKKVQNAKFVKVVHNGQVVHENVEVTGPTRAATYENAPEQPAGPLMVQGDHGPVALRKITLKPLKLD